MSADRTCGDTLVTRVGTWDVRAPLPVARIGRAAIGAGGLLARLWDWIRLPRAERFRCCARCGLTLDADRARKVGGYIERSGSRYCTGWSGEPYNRCRSATYRLG